jgi:hypothetical protein
MMNEMKTGAYIRGEESCAFNFYTDLTVARKLKFVNSVIELLIDNTHYNSVIRDLLFDFYVVDVMTDIDVSDLKKSPNFLNDVEEFLYETNIVDIVKVNASTNLFDELNKAVDDSVEYLTGIHKNPINDSLSSLLSTLEKKINEVDLDSMMSMAQKFAGITGELTPESIMNAYMDSDIHKQNLVEIAEARSHRTEIAENLDTAIKEVNEEAKVEN